MRLHHSRIAGFQFDLDGVADRVLLVVSWEVGRWSEGAKLVIPKGHGRIAWVMRIGKEMQRSCNALEVTSPRLRDYMVRKRKGKGGCRGGSVAMMMVGAVGDPLSIMVR